jgi:nicotinamidase-related amidase
LQLALVAASFSPTFTRARFASLLPTPTAAFLAAAAIRLIYSGPRPTFRFLAAHTAFSYNPFRCAQLFVFVCASISSCFLVPWLSSYVFNIERRTAVLWFDICMHKESDNLHASAPDKSKVALLIVDVINDLDFPEANKLLRFVPVVARRIARLKERAKKSGIPTIYVNDNFGRWRSDLQALVEHCRKGRARKIVELLHPEEDDYLVLKPKHSGFYSSTLETLLRYLGARTLIITGIAGNYCVLFTANDAYMRDYKLFVPSDCTVSNTARENRDALRLMRNYLNADTRPSAKLRLHREF